MGSLSRYSLLPALCLGLALGACERREQRPETGAAPGAADTTAATAAQPAPEEEDLSDANIVALLDEANAADSTAGALARTKATSKEVKDFAKLMMSEHHALRVQGQQLAKQLGVTPQPPANDPVKALADSETAALQAAAKGAEFDKVYIDQEVKAHEAVLDLAGKAHDAADNEQLKALIEKAKPVIEKHLDQAKGIQDKLGKPTA
jgi:putative membrane protein